MEPAHIFIVQATSVLALLAALAALSAVARAAPRISPGYFKTAFVSILLQTITLSLALLFMAVYHIFDIDIAQDLWHVGVMAGLLLGVISTWQFIAIGRTFRFRFKPRP
jgi:hypothetical protein